jgi:hypothetical protein
MFDLLSHTTCHYCDFLLHQFINNTKQESNFGALRPTVIVEGQVQSGPVNVEFVVDEVAREQVFL